ncbi:MAG: TenA family protein, partial [Glutamicibacter sp.]
AQRFWSRGANGILDGELQLHGSYLDEFADTPSATTLNYTNHLAASQESYGELIAAILPCYWLYQDIGKRLSAANHAEHPYRQWLETYASEEFDSATEQAIEMVRQAFEQADPQLRARMEAAFIRSAEHERSFFAQAHENRVDFSTA